MPGRNASSSLVTRSARIVVGILQLRIGIQLRDALGNGADETELYCAATDAIARLHSQPAPHLLAADMPLYEYDLHAQLAETDLMTEWFVPLALGRLAIPDEKSEHRALWREASDAECPFMPVLQGYAVEDYLRW